MSSVPDAPDFAVQGQPIATPAPGPAALAPQAWQRPDFLRRHLLLPLCVLATLFALTNLWEVDHRLADVLYAWEGHTWRLRNVWATEHLIHVVGRYLSTAAWLGALVAWVVACVRPGWRPLRRPLLYLLAATALSTLLVAVLKSLTNVDCPWDLARYGGTRPYIGLFEWRPVGLGRGRCFPAGHAGSGYCWVALYFFLSAVKPRWRWAGLAVGLGGGLLFGISQQLRGAHFASHDVATLTICWLCAVLLYRWFWHDEPAPAQFAGVVSTP